MLVATLSATLVDRMTLEITATSMVGKELGKFKFDPQERPSKVRNDISEVVQADHKSVAKGQVPTGLVNFASDYVTNCGSYVFSPDVMATYPDDEFMGEYKGKEHRWVNLCNDAQKAILVLSPVEDDFYTITNQALNEYLYASPFHDTNYGGSMMNHHGGMRRWVHTHMGDGLPEDNPAALWQIVPNPSPAHAGTFFVINKKYDEYLYVTQFAGPRGKEVHTFSSPEGGYKCACADNQSSFYITDVGAADRTRLILPDMSTLNDLPDTIDIAGAFGIKEDMYGNPYSLRGHCVCS